MKNKKIDTIIYNGLGFPIKLINVPLRKALGEWVLDINLNQLQITVLRILIQKKTALTGQELNFIRNYLEVSVHAFAELFGITDSIVSKCESDEAKLNPGTEVCIRLYMLDHLHVKDKEFRKVYAQMNLKSFLRKESKSQKPIEIDAEEQQLAA